MAGTMGFNVFYDIYVSKATAEQWSRFAREKVYLAEKQVISAISLTKDSDFLMPGYGNEGCTAKGLSARAMYLSCTESAVSLLMKALLAGFNVVACNHGKQANVESLEQLVGLVGEEAAEVEILRSVAGDWLGDLVSLSLFFSSPDKRISYESKEGIQSTTMINSVSIDTSPGPMRLKTEWRLSELCPEVLQKICAGLKGFIENIQVSSDEW